MNEKCPYCGAELDEDVKKCRYCGEWVVPHKAEGMGYTAKRLLVLLGLLVMVWAAPAVYFGAPTPCGMLKRKVLREAYGEALAGSGGNVGAAEVLGMGLGAGVVDQLILGLSPAQCLQGLVGEIPISGRGSFLGNRSTSRERQYFAQMKSDLKNLASQEEIYYADRYTYTSDYSALGFLESNGVTIRISNVGATGWAATATHAALGSGLGCSIYYGGANAPREPVSPSAPGEIVCKTR